MPNILFLTSHGSDRLLAYNHSILDVLRHRLIIMEEAFCRHHLLPAHALGRMLPSRINLYRPDLTQQGIDYGACCAGQYEAIEI